MHAGYNDTMSLEELERAVASLPGDELRAFAGWFEAYLSHEANRRTRADASAADLSRHTPGVVGGHARVRDTRIPVWTLAELKRQGRCDDHLLQDFPGLTQADLDAAWQDYRTHTDEIDDAIRSEAAED
jgi:uncharacterized protein (DUF433 family)